MRILYALPFILLLGLALRLPGIFWGEIDRPAGIVLEPDEFQHIDIALAQLKRFAPERYERWQPPSTWNLKGYGTQLAMVVYIADLLQLVPVQQNKIALLGRCLSIFYSLLLIFLIYHLTHFLFKDRFVALCAALFLAIFDLNITYSHYALPSSGYVFWSYAALFSLILLMDRVQHMRHYFWLIIPIGLSLAGTLALKLDFIPLFLAGGVVFYLLFTKKVPLFKGMLLGIGILLSTYFNFYFIHGFAISWQELKYSFDVARQLNENVVPQDEHLLYNPIIYLMGLIGGTSLPAFLLAFASLPKIRRSWQQQETILPFGLVLIGLFLALEFGVRWYLDTSFIRRAAIFVPAVAILAGFGLRQLWSNNRSILAVVIVIYTLSLTIVSQSNFWQDTRYQARRYLSAQPLSSDKIFYSSYAQVPGMPPKGANTVYEAEWIIMHESYYGRYWKYFTTPFKRPACCEEVYHCSDEASCNFYQQVLAGGSNYQLEKGFYTKAWHPERWIFKRFLGTYETFLGDLLIYRRQ